MKWNFPILKAKVCRDSFEAHTAEFGLCEHPQGGWVGHGAIGEPQQQQQPNQFIPLALVDLDLEYSDRTIRLQLQLQLQLHTQHSNKKKRMTRIIRLYLFQVEAQFFVRIDCKYYYESSECGSRTSGINKWGSLLPTPTGPKTEVDEKGVVGS